MIEGRSKNIRIRRIRLRICNTKYRERRDYLLTNVPYEDGVDVLLTDVSYEDDVDVLLVRGDGLHCLRLLLYPSLSSS
jgi:hypothetical protein